MYTPVLDDMSLENEFGMVKYGFQSIMELFVKRDTYSYEMDSRRSFENVGGTGEGAVMVYGGQAPAEGDERVEGPIVEFIPEEREPREDANDNSSGEESWLDPATEEVEEEEDIELPLPTMGVPPLVENDEPYPDPWIGVMDMDATYTNTMVPGIDDDNVPPPVGVGVDQRFMTKDALQMYLKDYYISRHVQFKVVMADIPLLYDQDSHRSDAIWHGEDPGCLECTEHFQTLRLWPLWAWERLHIGRSTLLEEPALQGGPLGSRYNVLRTNATNPGGNMMLYRTELDHQRSYQVKW
ncbi:hypothetical protein H6P81_006671 [Aristolochia fimbriata]|uniref:Uncharacterized protein n=1 Tax=Aristolochia fimbriata TaxID=158543 RepID=A0AAV7F1U5_ARIFI|nr:hypothetical protein H6P81_006671 [Aristolochia fimbriata]